MKSNNGAKTPQLPGGDDTFEQISTVIILDTFILALFSIVMLATALVSITTNNGLLNSTSRIRSDGEQDPKDVIARVEKRFVAGAPDTDEVGNLVQPAQSGSTGGSLPQNVLVGSGIFSFQRPAAMKFFGRPTASQVSTLEKFSGGLRAGKTGFAARVFREQVTPVPRERDMKDSPTVGGSDPWISSADFYDGYGISTIINNP